MPAVRRTSFDFIPSAEQFELPNVFFFFFFVRFRFFPPFGGVKHLRTAVAMSNFVYAVQVPVYEFYDMGLLNLLDV